MIIVTGHVLTKPDTVEQALTLSLEHVRRSRLEPGCLLHTVHRDVEEPLRLVFLEHWEDEAALRAHFAVPASNGFVRELVVLAAEPPVMRIYRARPIGPGDLGNGGAD